MGNVFMSYAREDAERVRPLVHALEQEGLSVFWDRTIPPGQSWHVFIAQALERARCVIVVWSQSSVTSSFILNEAGEGLDRNILVPVLFDSDLKPPIKPPLGFRHLQAADLTGFREGSSSSELHKLLTAVGGVIRTVSERETSGPTQQQPSRQAVQIGEVAFPKEHPDARVFYDGRHKGSREVSVPVRFEFPFSSPPRIIVSLRKIDLGDTRANIHRISVSAQNVVSGGFDLYFQTWEDSQIYDAVACWTAVG